MLLPPSCSRRSRRPGASRAARRSPAPASGCARTARARCRGCARGCPRCGLPTHRGRGCPAAFAAFPRAWAPVAYEGVARELVGALKFHARAARRRRDGGAHGREPARRRCARRTRRSCPSRRRRRTAARAGSTPRGCSRARSRGGSTARSRTAWSAAAGRRAGRRDPQRAPRAGPDRRARPRLTAARSRSSSTTSTRPARRSTPAPARSRAKGRPWSRRSATRGRSELSAAPLGDGAAGLVRPLEGGAVGAGERRRAVGRRGASGTRRARRP